MKLDHLLEYNMKNIFIEKLYAECGREFIPRPHFLKIKIVHVYRSAVWIVIQFILMVCPGWRLQKYIETNVSTTCFYFK